MKYFLKRRVEFQPEEIESFPDLGQKIKYKGIRLLPNEIDSEGFSVFKLKKR